MRKPIASVIFVLVFAVLPNIIPSRLLLTPDMALEMVHKSNEWGLGDPQALSTTDLLMLYGARWVVSAFYANNIGLTRHR
ncbi:MULTISPECIES: hypothetical protein [Pseudomonadota]|jgi:hypothetical protein|uniref:Uncharacterized protein n=1 Tax=Serratia marcescens TaxID=615 RepID=A0A349ZH86_SERMA|nr:MULTISPECIES: hypothetical protein [Pseudomonadota]MVZ10686.1 hypothetical protein [Enterobacteriaceae bacterium 8376wG6]ASM18912.1 hypothetical protein BVG90_20185 [Serratia marcescens]EGT0454498.1 hypothetical protein [Serratia marcescens]ELA7784690.1 hypothetical protein [Serratia marcescens]KFD15421.1 hypothetical protein GSMA_01146 [Serratia marcescens subsp. marcescens ATCC 13880]